MAKVIKYKFLSCEVDCGTEEEPNVEPIVLDVEIECKTQADLEANLPIAEMEAYNGEYTVEGEFDPEPESNLTLEARVGTLETDTADLAEALNMILEGVTE